MCLPSFPLTQAAQSSERASTFYFGLATAQHTQWSKVHCTTLSACPLPALPEPPPPPPPGSHSCSVKNFTSPTLDSLCSTSEEICRVRSVSSLCPTHTQRQPPFFSLSRGPLHSSSKLCTATLLSCFHPPVVSSLAPFLFRLSHICHWGSICRSPGQYSDYLRALPKI